MPTLSELNKVAKERRRIIQQAEKRLKTRLVRLEGSLNTLVIRDFFKKLNTDKDGNILKTRNNRQLMNLNKAMRNRISQKVQKELNELVNKELARIAKINDKYFKLLGANKKLRRTINRRRNSLRAQFKRTVIQSISANLAISNRLRQGIRQGQNIKDLRSETSDFIKGKDKLGVLSHHVWKQDGFEQFEVHSRRVQEAYANSLNLDYAIYQGGEIKTTREFCDEHNGKVYSRVEIARLGQQTWQGKKEDNNIFVDCGGYNCRHEWQWISKQLAVRLRPEVADEN